MKRYLALDGPSDSNGRYLTCQEGHNRGYFLSKWPNGEQVLMQSGYSEAVIESAMDGVEEMPITGIPGVQPA